MTWDTYSDDGLRQLLADHPNASNAELARRMWDFGVKTTKDAVQKRRRKLKLDPPAEPAQAGLSVPAAGDDFVGIRTIWWDLETTGLTGIMGRILCCSFADSWGNVKTFRYEDYPGESIIDDGPLCVAIRDELEKAGHWCTWNGKLYDVPMLNARLLKAGERPLRKDIMHTDLMYYARGQFVRIGSSKLVNVS